MEVGSGALSKLFVGRPNGRRSTGTPVWSRFDDRIYFATMPGLARQSSRVRLEETLSAEPGWLSDVSPDGNHALWLKDGPETGNDLWVLPLPGGKEPKPYLTTKHSESGGRFSPDGRWVAYTSDESGRLEVYVQSFPESGRPVTISRNGGQIAEWRQDGKELYFLTLDGKLMSVTVDGALSPFRVSEPKLLFSTGITADNARQQFYPDDKGERFLVNSQVEDKTAPALKVVLNWKGLLKK
jgi:dipeptidyl aminopeptidase/acylaminoacyl peptidase